MNDLKIECIIWGMSDGKVTEVKFGDNVFKAIPSIPSFPSDKTLSFPPLVGMPERKGNKSKRRGVKEPYLFKWIRQNNIKVFCIKDFYRSNPGCSVRRGILDRYISRLISEKKIIQLGNDKFKVVDKV